MNVALTTTVAVAASIPTLSAVAVVGVAYVVSRAPDKLEKPFRADHRTWTHWPLLGLVFALLMGWLAYAALDFAVTVHDPTPEQQQIAADWPWAMALGALCGYVGHILADALTVGGVPLLGPFDRRDRWLLPEKLRIRVFAPMLGPLDRRRPSVGDLAYRYGALVVTVLVILASQKGGLS